MPTSIPREVIDPIVHGYHENPFTVLGPHITVKDGLQQVSVRAFLPDSAKAWVVDPLRNATHPMTRVHPFGLFEAMLPPEYQVSDKRPDNYLLRARDTRGNETTMHDPYAFPPLLTEFDLYLFGEGQHWRCYEKLGAQLRAIEIDGGECVEGTNFAVWAPNAESVSVIGDFNAWKPGRHAMRKHIPSGVWELFVPGIEAGTNYKYAVKLPGGHVVEKSDPYGFAAEVPPRTASRVVDMNHYQWQDEEWIANREVNNGLDAPISIYEVHLGSWHRDPEEPTRWLNYRELAEKLVAYCQEMGFTHLELMPVSEHPFTGSWGYQTVGYYAATSRYGSPEDFMYFVDYCHQHDIGVIIDWVPAHFPKDDHGLRQFDGTALFEHADPRQGEHPDWGTMIFNYDRSEVQSFLIANALFWLDKYHIDGLRVDAVASMLYLDYSREDGDWIPNEYGGRENLGAIDLVKKFNEQVHEQFPGVLTIAEESTDWGGVSRPTYLGGLGFSLKWNMGWMNDTLSYMRHEPIHRSYHHDELTFSLIYAFTENFCLPLSHDEVVHGKGSLLDQMNGDLWQRFANLRLLYGYMWTHPGKKLLFMGGEFGQWHEWNCEDELQWDLLQWETHQGLKKFVSDMNRLYRQEPSLHEVDFESPGFEWIDCHDHTDSVLSYVRRAKDPNDFLVIAHNFTPVPRHGYHLGVPECCWYEEIANSDSTYYGGSDVGNGAGIVAAPTESHGRPASIDLTLPPLATVVLKPRR